MVEDSGSTSSTTNSTNFGPNPLSELARYLHLRRKFAGELGKTGFFLLDFVITQAVTDCNRSGLKEEAQRILSLELEQKN